MEMVSSFFLSSSVRTDIEADGARFANQRVEDFRGELYSLCKDQHGCRFLQKTLEEQKPSQVQIIFEETNQHVIELMTGKRRILSYRLSMLIDADPFGNYLCQKLLEFTNNEQRTVLINNAAPQMVKIAFNQHGTRALQKMIEFISTPGQVRSSREPSYNKSLTFARFKPSSMLWKVRSLI